MGCKKRGNGYYTYYLGLTMAANMDTTRYRSVCVSECVCARGFKA